MRINQISQTSFKSNNNRGQILLDGLKKNPNAFYERPIDVKLDIIYEKLRQAEKERQIINENLQKINENNSHVATMHASYSDAEEIEKQFDKNYLKSLNCVG